MKILVHHSSIFALQERISLSQRNSVMLSIRRPTASVIKSSSIIVVCVAKNISGNAMETASDATLSLDIPTEDGEANMYDCIPNSSPSMENVIADRLLLDQLFNRLRELDPDADTIIQCWLDDYKISDRAIAEKLGRKQRTFADQMKKIRTELRKIRGY